MQGDFILIGGGETAHILRRHYLGEAGAYTEAWLRNTLFAHPQILPIAEIDPTFGPLIPLCVELRTPAGPIDAAFINEQGRLTIVECKLWKNPQSRREVIGQVLDYVAAMSGWTYADLQRQVAAAIGQTGNVPFDLANERAGGCLREADFVDAVTRSLREGRILALVAGDGIREEVQRLAETINRGATKAFSLGLVEVALYDITERHQVLVQPRLLAKTELITRQVVVAFEADAGGIGTLEDVVDEEELETIPRSAHGSGIGRQHLRDWWKPVLEMPFSDPEQDPPHWLNTNNVALRTPYPGILIKAFALVGSSKVQVYVAGTRRDNVRAIEDHLRMDCEALLRELPPGTEIVPGEDWPIRTGETEIQDDNERRDWIISTLNTYVNVLRPRLRSWYAASHE